MMITDFPLVCLCCKDSVIVKDFDLLNKVVHDMWQNFAKFYDGKDKEDVPAALGTAAMQNAPERLKLLLEKQGFLTMMCRTCLTNQTEALLKLQGIPMIRIGNMLYDPTFYRKNHKEINHYMKTEYEVSFFT